MPFSPLISKIRCHSPNRQGSRIANRNNIEYIATRSGVDLSQLRDQEDLNEILREHPKSLEVNLKEDVLYNAADNDTFMMYMAKRPRSHGLFGNIDTTDLDAVSRDIYKLTKEGKNIYRGIISLSQKDAEMLGLTNKAAWDTYLRSVMPDICKELGISNTDFTWVAAYHAEKTHPHVHYQLWDNRDKVKSPYIHPSRQSKIRLNLSKQMFNEEYEKRVRELTTPERKELSSEKYDKRTELTNFLKDVFINFTEFVPGIEYSSLPSKIQPEELKIISDQLIELINHPGFPTSGSLDYAYVPASIKVEINNICDSILKKHDFMQSADRFIQLQGEISKLNGKTKYEIQKSKDAAKRDIYSRMGNIVLKASRNLLGKKDLTENYLLKNDYLENGSGAGDRSISEFEAKENQVLNNVIINSNNEFASDSIAFPDEEFVYNKDFFNDTVPTKYDFIDKNYSKAGDKFNLWTPTLKSAMKSFYDDKDYEKALRLFAKSAIEGNPIALEKLGLMYSKGLGVEINTELADGYYKKAFTIYNNIIEDNNLNNNTIGYVHYRLGKLYDNGLGIDTDYNNAKYCYRYAIDNIDSKYAMYSLGKIYLNGKGIEENENIEEYQQKSLPYIQRSADLEFCYAEYQMGLFCSQGKYVEQNQELADDYFFKAYNGFFKMLEKNEDDNVLYRLGQMTYDGQGTEKNTQQALMYLKKAMDMKNENAALLTARIYIELNDSEKLQEAIDILKELSKNDNNRANYSLGRIYATKENAIYNPDEALRYYELANREDNEHAQYGLGKLYADKESHLYDEEKAITYFELSAAHNNSYAQYSLGKIYYSPDSNHFDLNKAMAYFEQSAGNGNLYAAYTLGQIHFDQKSIFYDMSKAIKYFDQAANSNHVPALLKLGKIYEDETNRVYFNLETSNNYYEKAFQILDKSVSSENVNYSDYTMIANLYLEGKGVAQDINKGLYYMTEAADHDDANAQYRLGVMYLWGKNVSKDEIKGLEYLEKASMNGNIYADEAIQFYNDFKDRQAVMVSYDIFKVIHSMLEGTNREQLSNYHSLKAFRNRGKQANKEEALRLGLKRSHEHDR